MNETPYIDPAQGGRRCSDREADLMNKLALLEKICKGHVATITKLDNALTLHGWAIQGCSRMWVGEYAEIDAKAEARRCGGTCVAYPVFIKD